MLQERRTVVLCGDECLGLVVGRYVGSGKFGSGNDSFNTPFPQTILLPCRPYVLLYWEGTLQIFE